MFIKSATPDIKREKKKAIYLRELSTFLDIIAQDEPALREVFLSRVDLSADSGICYLYFATLPTQSLTEEQKEAIYKTALERLKLYKSSLRKNLAQQIASRYTPNLIFMYDEKKEKVDRINVLLDQVHNELTKTDQTLSDEDTDE